MGYCSHTLGILCHTYMLPIFSNTPVLIWGHCQTQFSADCLLCTVMAKIMWDTLAECNASTINRFSHGDKRSLGQILPSHLPPCNVVWKERLPQQSSNTANIAGIQRKRQYVPHILARIVVCIYHWPSYWVSKGLRVNGWGRHFPCPLQYRMLWPYPVNLLCAVSEYSYSTYLHCFFRACHCSQYSSVLASLEKRPGALICIN